MSGLSTSPSASEPTSTDFVLKHRVVGAAVILFLGALVLPWLLGEPSDAQQGQSTQLAAERNQKIAINESLREELLASLESQQELPEDQEYISKITPLSNVSNNQSSPAPIKDKTQAVEESKTVAKVEPKAKEKSEPTNSAANTTPKKETKAETAAAKPVTLPASSKPVTVGWAVQVGVFTDKNGVTKVLKDLRGKGFNPSTTTVDTNRGKGTRIWLGPFEERVAAAKMITKLSEKTGESGFIRSYP